MPTLDYLTGFNHRVAALDYANVGTAPTIETSSVRHVGGTSLKIPTLATTTGAARWTITSTNSFTGVCYIYLNSSFTAAAVDLFSVVTRACGIKLDGTGSCVESNSGNAIGTGPLSTNTWYRLEFSYDGALAVVSCRVSLADNTVVIAELIGQSVTGGAVTTVSVGAPNTAATTAAPFYATDLAWSTQLADYPIGPIQILGYSPNAVGTHNLDASTSTFFFTETQAPPGGTTTALTTSETTSYQSVDDVPIDGGTDAVKIITTSGSPNTPTFRSAGTWTFSANNVSNTTLTPGAPSGKAVGDLLLLVVTSTSNAYTVSTPSGWNLMTNYPKASGTSLGGKVYLFTRIADGTGTDTPGVVFSGLTTGTSGTPGGVGILAFTNLTETQDATAVLQDLSAQGSTSTITGITTATNHSMVINVAIKILESSGQTATVTTYTENSDNSTTSGSGYINENSHLDKATAGASGSGTITWSATTSARALITTIALKATTPVVQPTNTWYAE